MSQDRENHPTAATYTNGQRDYTQQPDPADIVRNFGGDYGTIYDKPAAGQQEG
jgi:hypothetical protein